MPKRLEKLNIQCVYVQVFPKAFLIVALSSCHEAIAEIDAKCLQLVGYGARSSTVHSQDNDDVFLLTVMHKNKWLAISRPGQLCPALVEEYRGRALGKYPFEFSAFGCFSKNED